MTPEADFAAIKALAAMPAEDIGDTEEDVKVRFVVPLLHALAHTKLRFEHKGMDILLKTGLPRGCTVVVETKRPDASLDARTRDKIRGLFKLTSTPLVPTGDYWDVADEEVTAAVAAATPKRPKGAKPRRKPEARQWTLEDVRAKATPNQVRIFSACVQLGKRTLGLKEIARHARLAPRCVSAATAPYRTRKEVTGREPLMETHRLSLRDRRERGNLYSITPRHWPLVKRACHELVRPAAKAGKKTSRKGRKDESPMANDE